MLSPLKVVLSEEDLQEIFALFSSPTDDEQKQVYDEASPHYYKREDVMEEYSLTQGKREFAEDAWRAVVYFLYQHGFSITREGISYDLLASSGYLEADT
ncbi:MAG: hypothetical protein HY237_01070 [Acidobacteria bacterium]|nr:hypothetical protein [Acidobacteriota bacterium]